MAAAETRLVRRLARELQLMQDDPPYGVGAWLVREGALREWEGVLDGPEETPYAGGAFKVAITVPDGYPLTPPVVRFVTPVYHPNIDSAGRICLDTLKMPPKGAWLPSLNIPTLLTMIRQLLAQPNPDDGLMVDITAQYTDSRPAFDAAARAHTLKHALPDPAPAPTLPAATSGSLLTRLFAKAKSTFHSPPAGDVGSDDEPASLTSASPPLAASALASASVPVLESDSLAVLPSAPPLAGRSKARESKFSGLDEADQVADEFLRTTCWSGIPPSARPLCWRMLLGVAPLKASRRAGVLARKHAEYAAMASGMASEADELASKYERGLLNQIHIDVLRMAPFMPLLVAPQVQAALQRLLFLWSLRHPGSGYVQGINDLALPFFIVFLRGALLPEAFDALGAWLPTRVEAGDFTAAAALADLPPVLAAQGEPALDATDAQGEASEHDTLMFAVAAASPEAQAFAALLPDDASLLSAEADTYWCLTALLDSIHDNYIQNQPGIQRMLKQLELLVGLMAPDLASLLAEYSIEYIQFAFRWMNCLLMRELSAHLVARLFDTYLAEGAFAKFHVFVCAALLVSFKADLMALATLLREQPGADPDGAHHDVFQALLSFLQDLPTAKWTEENVEVLLAEAYVARELYLEVLDRDVR
ncbi:uncharacterized protein AMSG_12052 [Thecamonas trahens ATCC 50062]|uniref:Uncharacterized protein n=1 Tax=Thecamonas trahens ATCC 50062 TaxID=461836 RepID=A0A0L0DF93_THETB|nr:hypothetical protein AMSG_12052 [Thecamonas trahens ATCC 50062]KNC50949.1 hypothetical protein AMSG_12052 [Thecamonas trahens ATCC 50062]|eukprot:XP_013756680.1 hypothetical protein AMSG_12052 [Thecamonas trahens ATCC 50062]